MERINSQIEPSAFESVETFRLFELELKRVNEIINIVTINKIDKKYYSKSHFYRCAIMRLLKEEEKRLKDGFNR